MTTTDNYRQRYQENTIKEQPWRIVTFDTFNQGYEETLPDRQEDNDNDNGTENDTWKTSLNTGRAFTNLAMFHSARHIMHSKS